MELQSLPLDIVLSFQLSQVGDVKGLDVIQLRGEEIEDSKSWSALW